MEPKMRSWSIMVLFLNIILAEPLYAQETEAENKMTKITGRAKDTPEVGASPETAADSKEKVNESQPAEKTISPPDTNAAEIQEAQFRVNAEPFVMHTTSIKSVEKPDADSRINKENFLMPFTPRPQAPLYQGPYFHGNPCPSTYPQRPMNSGYRPNGPYRNPARPQGYQYPVHANAPNYYPNFDSSPRPIYQRPQQGNQLVGYQKPNQFNWGEAKQYLDRPIFDF